MRVDPILNFRDQKSGVGDYIREVCAYFQTFEWPILGYGTIYFTLISFKKINFMYFIQIIALYNALIEIGYPILDVKFFPSDSRDVLLNRISSDTIPFVVIQNMTDLMFCGEVVSVCFYFLYYSQ